MRGFLDNKQILYILITISVLGIVIPLFYLPQRIPYIYVYSAVIGLSSYALPILLYLLKLERESKELKEVMTELVLHSKTLVDPNEWKKEAVYLTTRIGIPGSIVLGLTTYLLSSMLIASLSTVGLSAVTFFYPWLRAYESRSTLKDRVELELPVLSILMWGLSQMGYGIMRMIQILKDNTDLLPAVSQEFAKIYRDFLIFRIEPDDAIVNETTDHPSKPFQRLIEGSLSISRMGGDVTQFIDRMIEEVFDDLKLKWERFGKAVNNMTELTLLFLLMLPLVALFFGMVTGNAIYSADMVVFFMLPLLGFGLYMYLSLQYYSTDIKVEGDIRKGLLGLGIGVVVAIVIFILFNKRYEPVWAYIEAPILGFSLGYGLSVHRTLSKRNEIESRSPIFIRTIAEHIRSTGDNLANALLKLKGNKAFGKGINEAVDQYLSTLRITGEQRVPESKSWMFKTLFTVLVNLDTEGMLKYAILRRLSEISEIFYDAIKVRRNTLISFIAVSILSPVLLAGMTGLTVYVMYNISGIAQVPNVQNVQGISPSFQGLISFFNLFQNINTIIVQMLPSFEIMIVETGVIFGLLVSKASDGTIKNTFRIFQASISALISAFALQLYITLFLLH